MKRRVLVLGYGEMGHAMEYLLAKKQQLRIWQRTHINNLAEEKNNLEQEIAPTHLRMSRCRIRKI